MHIHAVHEHTFYIQHSRFTSPRPYTKCSGQISHRNINHSTHFLISKFYTVNTLKDYQFLCIVQHKFSYDLLAYKMMKKHNHYKFIINGNGKICFSCKMLKILK